MVRNKIIPHGSPKNPIPVPVQDEYVEWEDAYMKKVVGRHAKMEQALIHRDDQRIDRVMVNTPKGENHEFYFDVTENLGRLQKSLEAAAPPVPIRRRGVTIRRNDPCPCDSGKKFKKCCGSEVR